MLTLLVYIVYNSADNSER